MCVHTPHAHILHIICAVPIALVLIVTYHYLSSNLQAAPQRALLKLPEIAAKTSDEKLPSNVLFLSPTCSWEERREARECEQQREKCYFFAVFK